MGIVEIICDIIDEEIRAVNILYDALKSVPMSYALLHTQVDFLRAKVCYG